MCHQALAVDVVDFLTDVRGWSIVLFRTILIPCLGHRLQFFPILNVKVF